MTAGPEPAAAAQTVSLAELTVCLERGLARLGVAEDDARQIADVLLDAELRGYPDHGVFFFGELAGWFGSGALNPRPAVTVVHESATALLLDGDGGCGAAPAQRAMDWCVRQAKVHGLACAGIRHSGHFIAAAPYPTRAAQAGFVALAAANVTPLMPPPGGRTRTLGTNPLAFAAPTGGEFPVVFDMATSGIAAFKARLAARAGQSLPLGLIADALGLPSTDPRDLDAGGLVLPVGGHKGFGLAFVVEVLAGVLTGAAFGPDAGVTHGKEGHFFLAIDPERFLPRVEFVQRMDALVRHVKSGERVAGTQEIYVPGERGLRRAAALRRAGQVPIDSLGWQRLSTVCGSLGVPVPG